MYLCVAIYMQHVCDSSSEIILDTFRHTVASFTFTNTKTHVNLVWHRISTNLISTFTLSVAWQLTVELCVCVCVYLDVL